jgi:hypothetical protein
VSGLGGTRGLSIAEDGETAISREGGTQAAALQQIKVGESGLQRELVTFLRVARNRGEQNGLR